jgi:hypothetical protein
MPRLLWPSFLSTNVVVASVIVASVVVASVVGISFAWSLCFKSGTHYIEDSNGGPD